MSANRLARKLRRDRRTLLDCVKRMEERERCWSCAIPDELRQITTPLGRFCRERAEAADEFDRRFWSTFAVRFFYKIASGYSNKFIKYQTQMLDCQKWVDVSLQTMAVLLLSEEARRISSQQETVVHEATGGLPQPQCWTHLPRNFTQQEVQQGSAEIECRGNLWQDLQDAQAPYLNDKENKRRMKRAKVRIVVLEELARRILYGRSNTSSTTWFSPNPSPPPLQDIRDTNYVHYPELHPTKTEAFLGQDEIFSVDNPHRNRHSRRRHQEESGAIGQKSSQHREPSTIRTRHSSPSCASGNGRADNNRRRQRSRQRHEDDVPSERTTSQFPDPEIRRSTRAASSYTSANERMERQISRQRTSLSTHSDGGLDVDLLEHPSQQPLRISPPSHLPRRWVSVLVSERTTVEPEQPNTMRSIQRSEKHETDNHQAEQRERSRGRSISGSNMDAVNEPRHGIYDESIHAHPHHLLPPLRKKRRRKSLRSKSSSSSRNYGVQASETRGPTNAGSHASYTHEHSLPERVDKCGDSRPSANYDQYPLKERPTFHQGAEVYATTRTNQNASIGTASIHEPYMGQRSNGNVESGPTTSHHLDLEHPPRDSQRSRTAYSSINDSGSWVSRGVSDRSNFVPESLAGQQPNPVVDQYQSAFSGFEDGRSGRHNGSSTSRSPTRGYDSGVYMSSSFNSSSELVPEPTVSRRTKRGSRRYPPNAYNFDEDRGRRCRSSRSRSSSRNHESDSGVGC